METSSFAFASIETCQERNYLHTAIRQYPNAKHKPEEHDGFVIITAGSVDDVDFQDPRQVTLSPELAREWLDPATLKERAEEIVLFQGEPTEAFEWYPVDRVVGSTLLFNVEKNLYQNDKKAENNVVIQPPNVALRTLKWTQQY